MKMPVTFQLTHMLVKNIRNDFGFQGNGVRAKHTCA